MAGARPWYWWEWHAEARRMHRRLRRLKSDGRCALELHPGGWRLQCGGSDGEGPKLWHHSILVAEGPPPPPGEEKGRKIPENRHRRGCDEANDHVRLDALNRIVFFSGGVSSWLAAKRTVETHGTAGVRLLFTDTRIEDEDLYRFLDDAAADVRAPLVRIADGRTPWEVYEDVRLLGNTRADPCSRVLKRDLARAWVDEHCNPRDTRLVFGIGFAEDHRCGPIARNWAPYECEFPLCEKPWLEQPEQLDALRGAGLRPPRLYEIGFAHNNCGGFCCKAGQQQFLHALRVLPERFAGWEEREEKIRRQLGKDVAILRDRRGGTTKPLTLRVLRERAEAGDFGDPEDFGAGCGCFTDVGD